MLRDIFKMKIAVNNLTFILQRVIDEMKRPNLPVYMVIQFVDDDLCRKTEGIVRVSHLNLRIAWKGGPDIRNKLVKSAYLPAPCPGAGKRCDCCEAGIRGSCHVKKM